MNLKDASIGIRKAAARQGIRSGTFNPIFDPADGWDKQLAEVSNGQKTIIITAGDYEAASSYSWREI